MTNPVEKTATVAVDLQTKAVELIDQLTAGLKAVAPQMADVTLAAIRLQGVVELAGAIGRLSLCVAALYGIYRFLSYLIKSKPEWMEAGDDMAGIFACIVTAGATIAASVFTIFSVLALFSVPMWAAVIDPRLALALRVINRLM